MTIIDRDIEFYETDIQCLEDKLRRCLPQYEAHYKARIEAAKKVLAALQEYQVIILKKP